MQKLLLLVIFLISSIVAIAQYSFSGRILDEMQQPIEGVSVTLNTIQEVAITDSSGKYNFQYSSQTFHISFSHVGFETIEINVKMNLPETIVLWRTIEQLNETIVQAYGQKTRSQNIAAAVTVLNKNSFERLGTTSFLAAVNSVTGVKMDERSPGSYRLSIRANLLRSTFGVRNVKIYWNGLPFTDANGTTYLNQLSINSINKMEIIKGPAGSMYGSGTGGVVLMSSDNNNTQKEKWVDFQALAGSYGLFSANASYNQTGKNSSSLTYSHEQSNGYREQTNLRRDVINYSGSYLINSKQKIKATVFYGDLFYQTPGGLTEAEADANPKQARPAAGIFPGAVTQNAAIYLKTIYVSLLQDIQMNKRWNNTTGIYGSYTDFTNPNIRNYEKKYEGGFGGRSVFQYKQRWFTGTFGVEFQQGNIHTGIYRNKAGEKDSLQFKAEILSRQFNAFAQSDFQLPAGLMLSAGISYNNFHYGYEKTTDINAEKEYSSFSPQFVPRVSLVKKIKSISLYTSVSKGYSVPTIDEVHAGNDEFNTDLKAETAINYELGFKGGILKNKIWVEGAYYFLNLTNTIVGRRDSSGGDYFINAGETKQQGAELSINYLSINNKDHLIRQLKLSCSYTNIYAIFENYQQGTKVFDGNKLTGTAPNVFVINADLITAKKLSLNVTYSYTDHIPLNDANTFYAPSYQLFFAKLSYNTSLGRHVPIQFFVTAATGFDNPYSLGNDLNAAGNRYFNPSAPQAFSAGIQCRFKVK